MNKRLAITLLFLALFGLPLQAEETNELQAEIDQLLGDIAERKEGSTPLPSSNLGIGTTGDEVTKLQKMLISQGYLRLQTGAPLGYFGTLTQQAVAKWQAANGIVPATGFWGPQSREILNGSTTVGGTVETADLEIWSREISTRGVEGVFVANIASTSQPSLSVENDLVKVINFELSAQDSDVRIERVEINLGDDAEIFSTAAAKVHFMSGDALLGSRVINNQTVMKNSDGTMSATIYGMDFVLKAGITRTFSIALEARHTINSITEARVMNIAIPAQGIRGVDGTGANVYAPEEAYFQTFRVEPPASTEESEEAIPVEPAAANLEG